MRTSSAQLYETDFYGWVQDQVGSLRAGDLSQLDVMHLIDEVEDMGRSLQRALESRLEVLLMHLLKWQYQANLRSPSWRFTIKEQRRRIAKLLKKNPSLSSTVTETLVDAYESAVAAASAETGYEEAVFPTRCPWSFEQAIDPDFWPET